MFNILAEDFCWGTFSPKMSKNSFMNLCLSKNWDVKFITNFFKLEKTNQKMVGTAGHGAIFPPITTATSFVQPNLGEDRPKGVTFPSESTSKPGGENLGICKKIQNSLRWKKWWLSWFELDL